MTYPLEIRLFGQLQVLVCGSPIPRLRSRKGLLLLAHLALRIGRPVDRKWLAAVLWPDSAESQSRASLRQTLADLRRALGSQADKLQVDGVQTLRLRNEDVYVDAIEFDALTAKSDRGALERAIRLHEAPLLQGLDDNSFWQDRQAREQVWLTSLERLSDLEMKAGNLRSAGEWLRKLIAADPYNERAVRALMQALAEQADYAGVTAAWRELRDFLRREAAQEPAEETAALFRRLRSQSATAPLVRDTKSNEPATAPPGNPGRLPSPLTALVGREEALNQVGEMLRRSRLVMLTGSGGVGKTRLAIESAWRAAEGFAGGVRFVDLAGVSGDEPVPRALAAVLEVREAPGRSLVDLAADEIAERSLLMVLDNCEHVLQSSASMVDRLLGRCPKLRILATSRQPLGIHGEAVWRVPSLSVPRDSGTDLRALQASESVRLFCDRASDARAEFGLNEHTAMLVARICRRLDGIPLALELAAARMRTLTLNQIAERLDRRFELLKTGSLAALPRQQTLRALIDWSYDLLADNERALLRRLAVFSGGWPAEAACRLLNNTSEQSEEILASLVDKSLVNIEAASGSEPRYTLLETIREYARTLLDESGETSDAEQRHADWCADVAARASAASLGPDEDHWLRVLDREQENIRTALERGATCRTSAATMVRLAGAMGNYWNVRGTLSEGRRWLERAIQIEGGASDDEGWEMLLNMAGRMACYQGDLDAGQDYHTRCLALRRSSGDRRGVAGSLNNLAQVHHRRGEGSDARTLYLEAMAINRELDNLPWLAINLNNLGTLETEVGSEMAAVYLQEALDINRSLGNQVSVTHNVFNLSNVIFYQGRYEDSYRGYLQALEYARQCGCVELICGSQLGAAHAALKMGRLEEGRQRLFDSMRLARAGEEVRNQAYTLESLADLAVYEGKMERAARIFAGEGKMRKRSGIQLTKVDEKSRSANLGKVRRALGKERFAECWSEGERMTECELIDYACEGELDDSLLNT